ncbi:DUF2332 domain-containing protein [Streptacidiphilus sp. EB103A]|uniref:DUF2332 domain-containing protein n=1 Tax=Streptacidiphilus sp. EB103A TaxID=3156275 RepID=UPI003513110C
MDTAERYRRFATMEVRGHSASYETLAAQIAVDAELLALIDRLPASRRQPNLLLGAVRFLGGPVTEYRAFRAWTVAAWDRVEQTMRGRFTQTNEPGRCATLLPLLASLPQPLALIEVGASAGLCLYPDRYRYRYDGGPVLGPTDGQVLLDCRTDGTAPLPEQLPTVAWRAGIDLNPLDVNNTNDVHWLESLVWPEQHERLRRLRDAVRVAQTEPAYLVRGDLNEAVGDLIAQVPDGATAVVFHSAVLAYLPTEARESFAETVRSLPCHWISNEAPTSCHPCKTACPGPHRRTMTCSSWPWTGSRWPSPVPTANPWTGSPDPPARSSVAVARGGARGFFCLQRGGLLGARGAA